MNNIFAIDPSLTGTGLCWGSDASDWETTRITSKPTGANVGNRIERYAMLVGLIEPYLEAAEPKLIMIEGYSYGSKSSGMTQAMITEFGSLLRWHLVDHTPHVIEVAPSTLKKFATGKGNAKKDQVMAHVQKTWNVMFDSNDECDAFALYQMGLAVAGRIETTKAQSEAFCKALENHPTPAEAVIDYCNGVEPPPFLGLIDEESSEEKEGDEQPRK